MKKSPLLPNFSKIHFQILLNKILICPPKYCPSEAQLRLTSVFTLASSAPPGIPLEIPFWASSAPEEGPSWGGVLLGFETYRTFE